MKVFISLRYFFSVTYGKILAPFKYGFKSYLFIYLFIITMRVILQ